MSNTPTILTYNFLPRTTANGPGTRSTLWVQGCDLGCVGCSNTPTHPKLGVDIGKVQTPEQIMAKVPSGVEGITISGGEPFQQNTAAIRELIRLAVDRDLSVVIFTGYEMSELLSRRSPEEVHDILWILGNTDIMIAGRYRRDLPANNPLQSSSNQRVHFLSDRYTEEDLNDITPVEYIISIEDGTVTRTGTGSLRPKGEE